MTLTGKTRLGLPAVLLVAVLSGATYLLLGRAQGAPVTAGQPLEQTEFWPSSGHRFTPAPVDAKPILSSSDAYKAYVEDATPPGLEKETTAPPEAALALYTNDMGETPVKEPELVWRLTFSDAPVVEFGPDFGESSGESADRCPFYIVIDAGSGQRRVSFQTCDSPQSS